jgi:hypothetical protein
MVIDRAGGASAGRVSFPDVRRRRPRSGSGGGAGPGHRRGYTPRPGSRAEQRRRTEARILDAAARVFAAAGYERATIRAVASAAGVDAGLVMHYFGSSRSCSGE